MLVSGRSTWSQRSLRGLGRNRIVPARGGDRGRASRWVECSCWFGFPHIALHHRGSKHKHNASYAPPFLFFHPPSLTQPTHPDGLPLQESAVKLLSKKLKIRRSQRAHTWLNVASSGPVTNDDRSGYPRPPKAPPRASVARHPSRPKHCARARYGRRSRPPCTGRHGTQLGRLSMS